MIIKQNRITSKKYFSSVVPNKPVFIKVDNVTRFKTKLKNFGFDDNPENGTCILPCVYNSYSKKNAELYYTINRSLPKEEYIQTLYWTRTEWAGKGETREVTEFVDICRKRNHRDWHSPFSVYFTLVKEEDNTYVISEGIPYTDDNIKKLINTANMVLSMFGECNIDFEERPAEIKKVYVNWDILPKGEYPWKKIKPTIEEMTKKSNRTQKAMMLRNCETIVEMNPEFVAYGKSGFLGYVVFAFPTKKLFVLESIYPNNATYIFDEDWEEFSKLTKAEILSSNLQKARIIHSANWEQNFKKAFHNL